MKNLLVNIVKEKCPFCNNGDVFEKRQFLGLPKMHAHCPNCKRDFTGEPGYYFGAMYISYGLAVGSGILLFLVCNFLLNLRSTNTLIAIIATFIAATSFKNFKISRIIWLKIFPPGANTNFQKLQEKAGNH
jgi:hypothetical protein